MLNSKYYPKQIDISGARVLITGATSGIGRACAFRFTELQCQLILVGRSESKLQALGVELEQEIYQLQSSGGQGRYQLPQLIRLDVTEIEKIQELAHHIGPVDIIINNAGTNLGSESADQIKTENMVKMVLTNYSAPMAVVAAFSNMMKQRGNGHIINVCSTAGDDIYPNSSVYCSTKAALHAYTEAARHDLVDTPIRVTSISPGLVDTPLHEKKMGDLDSSRKTFEDIVPLYPEDIADQIVYACTRPRHVQVADVASYATNQSHSGVGGIKGVARVGPSLGASNYMGPPSNRGRPGPVQDWQNMPPPMYYSRSGGRDASPRNRDYSPRSNDYQKFQEPSSQGSLRDRRDEKAGIFTLQFKNGSWSSNPLGAPGQNGNSYNDRYRDQGNAHEYGHDQGHGNSPYRNNVIHLSN